MSKAVTGDKVKVHYTGYLKDGTVFDSTRKGDPIKFRIGEGVVLPGIEKAVLSMEQGDVKSAKIEPEDAFGLYKENLVSVVDRAKVSGKITLRLGMKLKARTGVGILKDVTVRDISDTSVTVDANHPLAGQELTFEIVLLEIMK